jgi:AraC family transcriptional regulator of adaptative response/methylated-DNA-[protein]-cysteine methyltransferase
MSITEKLPTFDEMYVALAERDPTFEGVFFVGVKTTGIFCRPTCSARKPNRENVQFFPGARDALAAGYRACRRCRPLEVFGTMPDWCRTLLDSVESDPTKRWSDSDLKGEGVQPERLRRWFNEHHGMTFQAYLRARRMSLAMGQISIGQSVTGAAIDSGYQSLSGFREAFEKWCGDAPTRVAQGAIPIIVNRIHTPLGPMVAAAADDGLHLLEFADRRMLETQFKRLARLTARPIVTGTHDLIADTSEQMNEYFAGDRKDFDLPLKMIGSDFQVAVWNQLQSIPYGQTISYEILAKDIGRPGAQRAVGRANGDNRWAIIVPCHRVIRSDGTLSGYGGGVWRKQRLLDHERKSLNQQSR